jgi:hypothetical protein
MVSKILTEDFKPVFLQNVGKLEAVWLRQAESEAEIA